MTAHLDQIAEPFSVFDLRIRLVPDTPADAGMLRQLGGRPFADGIVQVLAVDVDDAVRCVPTSEIAANGWDIDEAWGSARVQTELLEVPDEIHVIDIGGADLIHVFGERPFTAGTVGVIDDVIAEYAHIGELGAIVSMPLRHSVLVHPIDDAIRAFRDRRHDPDQSAAVQAGSRLGEPAPLLVARRCTGVDSDLLRRDDFRASSSTRRPSWPTSSAISLADAVAELLDLGAGPESVNGGVGPELARRVALIDLLVLGMVLPRPEQDVAVRVAADEVGAADSRLPPQTSSRVTARRTDRVSSRHIDTRRGQVEPHDRVGAPLRDVGDVPVVAGNDPATVRTRRPLRSHRITLARNSGVGVGVQFGPCIRASSSITGTSRRDRLAHRRASTCRRQMIRSRRHDASSGAYWADPIGPGDGDVIASSGTGYRPRVASNTNTCTIRAWVGKPSTPDNVDALLDDVAGHLNAQHGRLIDLTVWLLANPLDVAGRRCLDGGAVPCLALWRVALDGPKRRAGRRASRGVARIDRVGAAWRAVARPADADRARRCRHGETHSWHRSHLA